MISNKTKSLLLENKKVSLDYNLFKNDALILKTLESKSVTILENDKPFLRASFEDFPSLGIWTKINAPFLCIEPWFGYSDTTESSGDLFKKEGIIVLEPEEIFNCQYQLTIL